METEQIIKVISDIPASELQSKNRTYITQAGKCKVWVTEKLDPGTPLVLDGAITFPYYIERPNHRYNCTDHDHDSGHTSPATDASFSNKVTAKYIVDGGMLKISDVKDHGNTEETDGGGAIVRHLSTFS